jgi:hypothetical protein
MQLQSGDDELRLFEVALTKVVNDDVRVQDDFLEK